MMSQEVMDALHRSGGVEVVDFRYDILRNGVKRGEAKAISGSVSLNRGDTIQRCARFTFADKIDWLKEEIKPYMLLRVGARWEEFSLGVFVPSTPKENHGPAATYEVEAYDRTVILREDCITERLYFSAGTKYTDAVQFIVLSAGISNVYCDPCDTALPMEREWEMGTSKLDICNCLLSEVNFNNVWVDVNGGFQLKKYIEPTAANISLRYHSDKQSVLLDELSKETDYYSIPNVFIAMMSNPENGNDLYSIAINDNPYSPLSTVSRGRKIVSDIYRPDAIASKGDLDAYIRRIAFEQSQVTETVTFQTALMPIHGVGEIIDLRHPDANGIYLETQWELPLEVGGTMKHVGKKMMGLES